MEVLVEDASAVPAPALRGLVHGDYHGTRHAGFAPGIHRGLPTYRIGLHISLADDPIQLVALPAPAGTPGVYRTSVAGLLLGPALIAHNGHDQSVTCELTPAGVRAVLGVPAAALATQVVRLEDLLGRDSDELVERMRAAPDWAARFAVLDEVLLRQVEQARQGRPAALANRAVTHAWDRIVACGGTVPIGELAAEAGYSRQHLARRFAAEFGLTPKQVARIVRFERSADLLRVRERARRRRPELGRESLAEVAARCGFHDQAHLAREWNDLAGCPPSVWLATDELPFVQATQAEPVAA